MQYINDRTFVQSVLEDLYTKKYIKQNDKLYEFLISSNNLILNVYSDEAPPMLMESHILEKNVKGEFSICEDEKKVIHVVAANRKFDLIYLCFDGVLLKKETIYHYENSAMIPATPVVHVKNNLIAVVSEFLTTGPQKEWSLRAYIKKNEIWDSMILDKGTGLCYLQPDFKLDDQSVLHLVYRDYKERSSLKYISFDAGKSRGGKARAILESSSDKYEPLVYINRFNEVFTSWLEISGEEASLCCANISRNSNEELFRVDVSQNLSDVRIYFSGWHIYCIFQSEEGFYYDMCCKKKLTKQWNPKIIPKRGGAAMSSDFRQFLDVKRELEYKIAELKGRTEYDAYEKTIAELKQQNNSLQGQISELTGQICEKEKAVEAALNEIHLIRLENEKLKKEIHLENEKRKKEMLLEKEKQTNEIHQSQTVPETDEKKPEGNEKKSIWNSFLHYFSE